MKTLSFLVILFLSLHQISTQTQNLCRDAANIGRVYASDPSSCHRYLWCDPNGVTHTFDCRHRHQGQSNPFFLNDSCVSSSAHCRNLCPTAPPDIMIAVNGSCSQFRPCSLPELQPLECPAGTHFCRSTGVCFPKERAPCFYDQERTFSCRGLPDGPNPYPHSCTKWVFCWQGEILHENECLPGYVFDPALGNCRNQIDANDCPNISCPNGPNPVPGSCTRWVFCWDGEIIHESECQPGYVFDPNFGVCRTQTADDDCPSPFSCRDLPNGPHPVPGICTEWVFCWEGQILVENECQPGYVFDSNLAEHCRIQMGDDDCPAITG